MPTHLIRSLHNIRRPHQGGVIAIGNFDGVHLGHQHLIKKVVETAKHRKVPSLVITFEPHPHEFFEKAAIPRLTRLREKFKALKECLVGFVLILPFNQKLASLSASDFVNEILVRRLKAIHIVVGEDFRFGQGRQGDVAMLKKMGKTLGFTIEVMPALMVEEERVSSTRVRKALAEGDHVLANKLLGHPYTMHGRVGHGDSLGRVLGFRTANIHLLRKLSPVGGIYVVYMHDIAGRPLPGVANVGTRPTIGGTRTLLEVHLLDFNQNIYGRYVRVEFCKKLRDEIKFDSLALLKEQIAKDVAEANDYFRGV